MGRNRFQEFAIRPDDVRHVVVISIVKCRRGKVGYHPDRARALGITLAATLTEDHLAEIARFGLTISDVLFFLNQVRIGDHGWPLGYVPAVVNKVLAEQTIPRNVAHNIDPKNFKRGMALLQNLRIPSDKVLRREQYLIGDLVGSRLISDLLLPELFHCARAIALATQAAAPPPWGSGINAIAVSEVGVTDTPSEPRQ